jgi:hypothetical protein
MAPARPGEVAARMLPLLPQTVKKLKAGHVRTSAFRLSGCTGERAGSVALGYNVRQ